MNEVELAKKWSQISDTGPDPSGADIMQTERGRDLNGAVEAMEYPTQKLQGEMSI